MATSRVTLFHLVAPLGAYLLYCWLVAVFIRAMCPERIDSTGIPALLIGLLVCSAWAIVGPNLALRRMARRYVPPYDRTRWLAQHQTRQMGALLAGAILLGPIALAAFILAIWASAG